MRIVHYTLGLYPDRSGGLNRYSTDLIKAQSKEHDVVALLPGPWRPWRRECRIERRASKNGIKRFVMCNALPIPLLYGIRMPSDFMTVHIDKRNFEEFFVEMNPDVIHLHTLMGMPEEALCFFKDKGVKIVYTSHDYFGICPKVNLINNKGILCGGPKPERCALCNSNAPSTFFLRLRNSNLVFKVRDIIRWIKSMTFL